MHQTSFALNKLSMYMHVSMPPVPGFRGCCGDSCEVDADLAVAVPNVATYVVYTIPGTPPALYSHLPLGGCKSHACLML